MSKKVEIAFQDVEGTPWKSFFIHSIQLPNGAVYDAVNGWRRNCPPPDEPQEPEFVELFPFEDKIFIEVSHNKNGFSLAISKANEPHHDRTQKWPKNEYTYGIVDITKDMGQATIQTDFGTVLIGRND